ncbi:hypothetical protein JN531_014890 [Flagellatimonas centrodinii]|uniref:FimV/HubP family polar landmark protein n=1 Tax=Flagellatimonas centrodinii TaxID=2806210 RepID=UPI001FEDED71|nr:FimV/HubP family polar landmark protein [Flagellatimonas centrodinii]ULQ46373.1 hypothetical protein JN531_014890 [Flagellatimonas centrodinii]
MRRRISAAAGLGMACWSSMALALGLGDIDVRSGLNQPFIAQIPLLAVSAEDAENLQARLADNAEFERLGIERADYLSHLRFEVKPGATPYIAVSGNRPAREPFLMFLLDVRSAGNRILREYTVLLDPPTLATEGVAAADAAAASSSTGATPSSVTPVTAAPAPASTPKVTFVPLPPGTVLAEAPPPTPTPAPSANSAATTTAAAVSEYGPIAAGETFWAVTVKVVRSLQNVTVDQVMLALYNANPRSFDNGSINALMKGQVLSVPSADSMRAVSPEAATAQVQALRAAAGRAPAATSAVTPAPTPRPTITPTPTAPPATPAPTPVAAAEIDTERLSNLDASADAPPSAASGDAEGDVSAAMATDTAADTDTDTAEDTETAVSETDPLATAERAEPGSRAERVAEMLATPTPAPAPVATPAPAAPPAQPGLLDALLLPLLLLALLVAVVVGVLWRRRRAQTSERQPPEVMPSSPSSVAMPAAAAGAKPSVPDADAMADEAEAAVMAAYAKTGAEDDRQGNDDAVPDFDATQVFDAPLDSGRKPVPETTDFEATAQFSVDTVQIDLNAQDPVAEADIHLAYGLYDEAALTLKAALEKAPDDGALHAKLAEVYFAAGRPLEFVEAAEAARPHVSPADWQKLALFGSQIAPDSSLFADAGSTDDGALSADLDLSFDDVEETSAAGDNTVAATDNEVDFNLEFDTPATPGAAATSEPQPAEAPPGDNVLDFQLDDIDAVMASTPALDLSDENRADAPAAAGDDTESVSDNSLEFRLDDFGADDTLASPPPSSPESADESLLSVESPVDAPVADVPGDGLSLPELDTEPPAETPPPASDIANAGDAASVPLELDLAEFDLGVEPAAEGGDDGIEVDSATIEEFKLDDFELESDSDVISSGDEAGTKLDLARAYVDMGDNEMARVLLDEVLAQGSEAQKSDARALISRLG